MSRATVMATVARAAAAVVAAVVVLGALGACDGDDGSRFAPSDALMEMYDFDTVCQDQEHDACRSCCVDLGLNRAWTGNPRHCGCGCGLRDEVSCEGRDTQVFGGCGGAFGFRSCSSSSACSECCERGPGRVVSASGADKCVCERYVEPAMCTQHSGVPVISPCGTDFPPPTADKPSMRELQVLNQPTLGEGSFNILAITLTDDKQGFSLSNLPSLPHTVLAPSDPGYDASIPSFTVTFALPSGNIGGKTSVLVRTDALTLPNAECTLRVGAATR